VIHPSLGSGVACAFPPGRNKKETSTKPVMAMMAVARTRKIAILEFISATFV
jgi:hypothetical protein